jgi:hypothetical protein
MGKNSLETVRQKIDKLIEQRDRIGKDPLTIDERISYLNSAYDAALVYLVQCVTAGTTKSTAALCTVLERTRLELMDWQRSVDFRAGTLQNKQLAVYEITDQDAILEEMFASESADA